MGENDEEDDYSEGNQEALKKYLENSKKRMEELNKLSEENPLASLEEYEKIWKNLPTGPSDEFLEKMKSHSDTEVCKRAKEVEKRINEEIIKTYSPGFELLKASTENYLSLFNNHIKEMESVLKASELSTSFLNSIATNDITTALTRAAQFLNEYREVQLSLPSIDPSILSIPETYYPIIPSPIIRAKEIIIDDKEPEYIEIPDNKDFIFNIAAYKALLILEPLLRKIIKKRIIGNIPGERCDRLPNGFWDDLIRKQRKEIDNPLLNESNDPLDYSDFTDIYQILNKRRNKTLFNDKVNDQLFTSLLGKLTELEGIRNKIAHSRILTKEEFERFVLYTKDFSKLFN